MGRKGRRKGTRRKGIHWEYNYDGLFPDERWDPEDKRYWTRWRRRLEKKEAEENVAGQDVPCPR